MPHPLGTNILFHYKLEKGNIKQALHSHTSTTKLMPLSIFKTLTTIRYQQKRFKSEKCYNFKPNRSSNPLLPCTPPV